MRDTIKIKQHGTTKIVAHRGVSGLETENTAAAYIAAGNRSYWGIETDIYRTSDGHFICSHDKSAFTPEEIAELIDIFDGYLDRTCFISFKYQNLELIKKLRPEQHCQFLTDDWDKELPQKLATAGMGLDISYTELSERKVRLCHEAGVEVNCWTVDTLKDAEKLIRWGVDQITTNILE